MRAFVLLLLLTNHLAAQKILTKHFYFQDRNREYIIFLPTGFSEDQKLPIYLVFHGNLSTDKGMMDYCGVNKIADTAKFIAVYPQGVSKSWADGRGSTDADEMHVDDVGFISALIDTIVANYHADVNRVYASGISNGGFMVQRLLCELTNKIAAGASIGAEVVKTAPLFFGYDCPKPVMIIHGTKDKYVPYAGGPVRGKNGGNGEDGYCFSADSSVELWAARNGCNGNYLTENVADVNPRDDCTVIKKSYTNCDGQDNVILYEIVNGGHSWPGGRSTVVTQTLLGNTNQDINAGAETWNFFKTKSLAICTVVH